MWNICDIAQRTINEVKKDNAKITSLIPTGAVVEMAQLVEDGFSLEEIAEMAIYPDYDDDGGSESERVFMKQLIQAYIPSAGKSPLRNPLEHNRKK
jgi:hypothetical protein